ncbi:MAG: phosphoglycolate phosphatase [Gammaproteobacteria bacterium]|nr:MAG: phosphoglycolate phosphatase [Gammaproteobacteria bacterium]
MSFNNIDTLLFDLDGTLIDSVPDLTNSANFALRHIGLPERSEVEIRSWVGNGVDLLIHRTITGSLDGLAPTNQHQQAKQYFYEWYSAHSADLSRRYPGVIDTLNRLHSAGFKLACVTNKPERFTQPLLDHFQIGHLFNAVVGGDSTATRKPDPEPLFHAVQLLGSSVTTSVMIGDSINDFQAAKNAKMASIMVTWGYDQGIDLAELAPAAVIDDMTTLLKILPALN